MRICSSAFSNHSRFTLHWRPNYNTWSPESQPIHIHSTFETQNVRFKSLEKNVVINKWLIFWITWFFHRSSHLRMKNDVRSDRGIELWTRSLSFLSSTCWTPICHGSLKSNWFSLLVSISKSWFAQKASANLLINPVNVISQATGGWSMFPLTGYTWRFPESQGMFENILCAKWYILALLSNFPRTLFFGRII